MDWPTNGLESAGMVSGASCATSISSLGMRFSTLELNMKSVAMPLTAWRVNRCKAGGRMITSLQQDEAIGLWSSRSLCPYPSEKK
jgi:hypothetical protein